jgi:hypothetical protein
MNFSTLTFADIESVAEEHGVPRLDALLIACNSEGAQTDLDYARARMRLRPHRTEEVWQLILPLDNPGSPFVLAADGLWLGGTRIADVIDLENDDVVLTYLRCGGRSLTLNTHSRSTCTGCVFCPNVIEDAADANLTSERELSELLSWVEADNGWTDLRGVDVITVCSGCFHTPAAAIQHMSALRAAASAHAFEGYLHLLSSVVRERRDLEVLARAAGPFHLTLTLECFTRRELLLKATKASLTLDEACRILDDVCDLGMVGDFTYVAGLDPYAVAVIGLTRLAERVTTFPRIQVYQAHNDYMRRIRTPEANSIAYYLQLRNEIEGRLAERGLVPRSWENYRPLWYSTFAGRPVGGPRI